jgi:hypothetical protein
VGKKRLPLIISCKKQQKQRGTLLEGGPDRSNIISGAGIVSVGYWAESGMPVPTEPAARLAAAE